MGKTEKQIAKRYDRVLNEDEVAQNFSVKSNELAVEPFAGKLTTTWSRVNGNRCINEEMGVMALI